MMKLSLSRYTVVALSIVLAVAATLSLLQHAPKKTEQLDPGQAYAQKLSQVMVTGSGTVTALLKDDLKGSRHQRFIVRVGSGQTLLISHNIDLAPRIDDLARGDYVRFRGEYVYNDKGGLLHWTHHDPKGRHPGGWLEHRGSIYR